MPHFGSGNWVTNYGPLPYAQPTAANPAGFAQAFTKTVAVLINTVATNTGVTEGTDLATFTASEAGLFRVSVYAAVNVASDATAETVAPVMSFTDAVGAKSNVAVVSGATQATMNAKTAGAQASWLGVCRVTAAAPTIAVKIQNVITTAGRTVGSINWYVTVEKIGE